MLTLRFSVLLVLLAACTTPSSAPPIGAQPSSSLSGILASLRAEKVDVKEGEILEQPFFPVPAHLFSANGEDLHLYEFATAADAERAAGQVDASGSTIGTTKMAWLAAPHFYRKDRVIAILLGD